MSPELKIMAMFAIIVIAGVGYFVATGAPTADNPETKSAVASASSDAPLEAYSTPAASHGGSSAKAVLVKYTDFQ